MVTRAECLACERKMASALSVSGEKSALPASNTSVTPSARSAPERSVSAETSNFGTERSMVIYLLSALSGERKKSTALPSESSASGVTPSSGSRNHIVPLPSRYLPTAAKLSAA